MFDFFIQIFWLMLWTAAVVMAVEQLSLTVGDWLAVKKDPSRDGKKIIAKTNMLVMVGLLSVSCLNIIPGILALSIPLHLFSEAVTSLITVFCLVGSAMGIVGILIVKRWGRTSWTETFYNTRIYPETNEVPNENKVDI